MFRNACPVKEEVVAPFWANNTRGELLALLNLYPYEQYVHWEKCTFEHRQMYCRDGCRLILHRTNKEYFAESISILDASNSTGCIAFWPTIQTTNAEAFSLIGSDFLLVVCANVTIYRQSFV